MTYARPARPVSEQLVSSLGRRWRHVQGVAARAALLTSTVSVEEGEALVASAWLHDIGYAEELAVTGCTHWTEPVTYAMKVWPGIVVSLVAHHTSRRRPCLTC
jgi:hypothetical protein